MYTPVHGSTIRRSLIERCSEALRALVRSRHALRSGRQSSGPTSPRARAPRLIQRQAAVVAGTLLTLLVASVDCRADEPPIFSPPGTIAERGHFIEHDGAALYRAICQGCHMPDAHGARGAGMYPALAANPKLASAPYPALTVLGGRHGMPAFGDSLTDQQVADVVNYVRGHFDNHFADSLSADDVARLRATLAPGGAR